MQMKKDGCTHTAIKDENENYYTNTTGATRVHNVPIFPTL